MANSKTNVIVAKPKVTGGISVAPLGTTLPIDPATDLGAAFTAVGYITSDGVTRSQDRGADTIAAWGGSTIAVTYGEQSATVQFSVAEYLNEAALALVYGDANVKVTAATTTKAKKIDSQVVDAGRVFGMKPNTAWIVFGVIVTLAVVGAVVIFR